MKRLISLVLCAIMLMGVLAFAGCKSSKDTDTTGAPSDSAAVAESANDTTVADTTASDSTAAATEKKNEKATKPVSVPAAATTEAKVAPAPTVSATEAPHTVETDGWNSAGNYKCGIGTGKLKPGEYYIVKTSSNASVYVWNGKDRFEEGEYKGQGKAFEIDISGEHTLVTIENGYELYLNGCKAINANIKHPGPDANGKYKSGVYKLGRDIPLGEYIVRKTSNNAYAGMSFKQSTDPYVQNVASDLPTFIDVPRYYTFTQSGYVHITDCELVKATDSQKIMEANSDGTYSPAMYKVGKDIKAGSYQLTPAANLGTAKPYYEICTNSTDSASSTKESGYFDKATNVTVKDGEYILIYNCTMKEWKNPNSGLDLDAQLPQ